MKTVLRKEYEAEDLICSNCGFNQFNVVYNENCCECGPCLNISCVNCRTTHDFDLAIKICSKESQDLIDELKQRKKYFRKWSMVTK